MTLRHLLLQAGRAVDGLGLGRHPLRRLGRAQTFREHRAYQPGDDLRHVDWHALARHDALYTKVFEDEAPIRVEVVLDTSGSMATDTKFAAAQVLGCALARLALDAGEEAGLFVVTADARHGLHRAVPAAAGRGHAQAFAQAISQSLAQGTTPLAEALWTLGHSLRRRSHIFIFSDFWVPISPLALGLRLLSAKRHDITVVCLQSANEQRVPGAGPTLFLDTEGDIALEADADSLQAPYQAALAKHDAALRSTCLAHGATCVVADTAATPQALLTAILTAPRARRRGV